MSAARSTRAPKAREQAPVPTPPGHVTWELPLEVTTSDGHRRAFAKKLGMRGKVSKAVMHTLAMDLLAKWAEEACSDDA